MKSLVDEVKFGKEQGAPSRGAERILIREHRKGEGNDVANFSNLTSIQGKNIDLRLVQEADAEFILSLRLDPDLNRYLSPVEDDIDKQRAWIRKSLQDHGKEWYFIIQNKRKEPVGTIRIYDIREDSFCWGSWIVMPEARRYASFESAILLYQYAFGDLGFHQSHFDVRKANQKVINFHLKLGAKIVREDKLDVFFIFLKKDFLAKKEEYLALIKRIE